MIKFSLYPATAAFILSNGIGNCRSAQVQPSSRGLD